MPSTSHKTKQPAEGDLTMRQAVAARLRDKFAVEVSWKFGHASFQTHDGKVFCFITRDSNLAMKLPAERIESLVDGGRAVPLRMGKRTMREWAVVPAPESSGSLKLLREAQSFVESLAVAPPKRKPGTKKLVAGR